MDFDFSLRYDSAFSLSPHAPHSLGRFSVRTTSRTRLGTTRASFGCV